jgi:hypothetical protein
MDEYAMREQPPSQEELASTTKFFLEHPTSTINDEGLWGYALELIYSGNAASAKQYLNIVWPAIKNVPADDTMYDYSNLDLASFEKGVTFNLQRSPYYEALLNLNGGNIFWARELTAMKRIPTNKEALSLEEYRKIMKDDESTDEQIQARLDYLNAFLRNVIRAELDKHVENHNFR